MPKKKLSKREWKGIVITSVVLALLIWLAMFLNQPQHEVIRDILKSSAGFTFLTLLFFVLREIFGIKIFRR